MAAPKLSTLSKKGQTTIPQDIREKLNLKEGDLILFELKKDGQVVLKKAPTADDMNYLKSIEKSLAQEWMSNDDDDL